MHRFVDKADFFVTLINHAGIRALRVISVKSTSQKVDRFLDLTEN
jgi:hypothetical protein